MDSDIRLTRLLTDLLAKCDREEPFTLAELTAFLAVPADRVPEFFAVTNRLRRRYCPCVICCSIVNAKSGDCTEDCAFCASSARHRTGGPRFPLRPVEELVRAAREARDQGAGEFSIVTSGKRPTPEEFEALLLAVARIRAEVGLPLCASLGLLPVGDLRRLKEAGLSFYHHNLETAASR